MKRITILLVCFFYFNSQLIAQKSNDVNIYEPIPSWIKTYPKPTINKQYELGCVRVHKEIQYNHVKGENYNRLFFYINDKFGIADLGTFTEYYEPDYKTFHLHKVAIHRKGKSNLLTDKLHTEIIHSNEKIGTTQYDDDSKFIIYFDKLKVGDLVEIAYSINGKQPDLDNALFYKSNLEGKDFVGKSYNRILNYSDKPIQYTILNSDEKPTIKKHKDYYELELISTADEALKSMESGWYIPYKRLYATDLSSWEELTEIDLKNHQLEIPPSKSIQNKVKSLTKGIKDKDKQITAILDFIQRDIEYLEYGLIEPKRPEITLGKGYGDCKSMSLLTIKMLECIGIRSYPVSVHSEGIDDRLIHSNAFIFDHEVIEFIHKGDTILFDATMDFTEGLSYEREVNDFRYGLRTIENVNELTRFPYQTDGTIVYNETKTIRRNYLDELEYTSDKEIIFEGSLAKKLYQLRNRVGLKEMWHNGVHDHYTNTWCFFPEGRTSFQYERTLDRFTLYSNNQECNSLQIYRNDDEDILKSFPNLLKSWWENFGAQRSSPLIEVLPFDDVTFNYKIVLEDSIYIKNDSIIIQNDWLEYKQVFEQKANIIYATYHIKLLERYLPNKRYDEVEKVINQIQDDMIVYIDKRYLPRQPKWKNPEHYIPFVMIGCFISFVIIVWRTIRTLRRRKKRIAELENKVEVLEEQLNDKN